MASSVGRPLYADHLTESEQRLSFAKICVEVDISSTLPSSFDLKFANGDIVEIRVLYPWKPIRCSDCQIFGHVNSACPKKAPPNEQGAAKPPVYLGKNVAPELTEWQVVGSLRKEAPRLTGHQAPAPASKPIAPGHVKGTVTTQANSIAEHAANSFAMLDCSALDETVTLPMVSKVSTLRTEVPGLEDYQVSASASISATLRPGPVMGAIPAQANSLVEHAVNSFAILDNSVAKETVTLSLVSNASTLGTSHDKVRRDADFAGAISKTVVLPDDLSDDPPTGGDSLEADFAEGLSVDPPNQQGNGKRKGNVKAPPTKKGGGGRKSKR